MEPEQEEWRVLVCQGPRCSRRDSAAVRAALQAQLARAGLAQRIRLLKNVGSCLGLCKHGPNMMIYPGGTWYAGCQPADVPEVVDKHLVKGEPIERLKGPDLWDDW